MDVRYRNIYQDNNAVMVFNYSCNQNKINGCLTIVLKIGEEKETFHRLSLKTRAISWLTPIKLTSDNFTRQKGFFSVTVSCKHTLSLGILVGRFNVSICGKEGKSVPPDDDIRQCWFELFPELYVCNETYKLNFLIKRKDIS